MNTPDWWHEQTNQRITEHSSEIAVMNTKLDHVATEVTELKEHVTKNTAVLQDINSSLWFFKWIARVCGILIGFGLAISGKIAFMDIPSFAKLFKG